MYEPVSPQVVVVGSLNLDLVTTVEHLPREGETVLGHTFNLIAGGKGFNQAVAARRSGSRTALIGKIGQDDFGTVVNRALLREDIVDTSITRCIDNSVSTGVASIAVDARGRNTIAVVPGANFKLDEGDIVASTDLLTKAKVLLLQLEVPLPTCVLAAQLAHQAGCKVVLTVAPVPMRPLPSSLLSKVDIVIVNEIEMHQLVTFYDPVLAQTTLDEANLARQLLTIFNQSQSGPTEIVVTLGERGLLRVGHYETLTLPGFDVLALDTTAAGDTFTGALATGLAKDLPIIEALNFANAAAALAVTRRGASVSIPYFNEISSFLDIRIKETLLGASLA